MSLEWRTANRSLIDILERVLEKGLLVSAAWLRPANLSVGRDEHAPRAKARPRRTAAARPHRK
jgi:hypothetical protein